MTINSVNNYNTPTSAIAGSQVILPAFADLAQEYLSFEERDRLVAFEDLVSEYAERRGLLCASQELSQRDTALAELDREFFDSLTEVVPKLGLNLQNVIDLKELSLKVQTDTRIEEVEKVVREYASDIGSLNDRNCASLVLAKARDKLNLYVQSQADLVFDNPERKRALERLIWESEEAGLNLRLECEKISIQLHRAMRFGSRDAESICQVLSGLNLKQISLLHSAYEERYGMTIKQSVEAAFVGLARERALSILAGEVEIAQAHAICLALQRGFGIFNETKRFLALKQIFESTKSSQWPEIERQFNARHATLFHSQNLTQALQTRLKSLSFKCLSALKHGDSLLADTILIKKSILGDGLGRQVINHTLEKYKNGDIEIFKSFFEKRFNYNLAHYIRTFMPNGCQKDRALAVIENDRVRFLAARVKCALGKLNGETIGDVFLGKPYQRRLETVRAFESVYQVCFEKELVRALSVFRRKEFKLIQSLVKDGELSPEQLLRYFIEGIGTNEDGIMAVLKERSKADIYELIQRYAAKFSYKRTWLGNLVFKRKNGAARNLIRDLRADLSGDSWFECAMALRGRPDSLKKLSKDIRIRLRHEMSGRIFKLFLRRTDLFPRDCRILIDDVKLMKDYYLENIRNRTPSREQVLKFHALAQLASVGLKSFRGTKLTVATHAANTFAAGVGIGVGYLGLELNKPLQLIAVLVLAATWSARTLIHRGIRGNAYGVEQAVLHTVFSLFDGLGFGARKFLNGLWGLGARFVGKVGAKQMLSYTEFIGHGRTTLKMFRHEDLEKLDGENHCIDNCQLDDVASSESEQFSCNLLNKGLEDGWARVISNVR